MGFLDSLESSTRHDVPKYPWMDEVHMELVTVETLDQVIDECIAAGRYALDLETTGLDNRVFVLDGVPRTRASIVGFCLSPDGKRGYYIPVRHQKGEEHNLPILMAENAIRRLVNAGGVAIFHNAKFDQEFLQFCGGDPIGTWDEAKKFEDTLLLTWLRNTRQKIKNLKFMSKTELGKEMIELKQLFPPEYKGPLDFSLLDPSWDPCVWYACSDAICTYLLFEHIHPQVVAPDGSKKHGQEGIYNIEKMALPATRWMERCRVFIAQDKVSELMQLGQQEMYDCLCDIYDFCNKSLGRTVEPGWFRLLRDRFVANDPSFDINQQIEECRKEARRKGMDDASDLLDEEADERSYDMTFLTAEVAKDAKASKDKKVEKGPFISKEITLVIEDREETFTRFPERYDVLSRPQLGPLFCELQIPDLSRTDKSGQIQTTADEIERLEEEHGDKYPFLPKIKRLGELQKALGTYLISLARDVGPDGTLKVNYNQCGTETGRYTTPASEDPKNDGGTKYPVHGTPAVYDKSRPACLLRIRETLKARPNKIMVSIDYGGVELRIATILSGEPNWLVEYFRCSTCGQIFEQGDGTYTPEAPPGYCPRCGDDKIGDLHTATGITFYGADAVGGKDWKQQRQGAKCVHPDTLILSDKGLRRIGNHFEFGEEDEFLSVSDARIWNGREQQTVKASYNGGTKSLFHVVTHRGIVTCSDQHRFKLADGSLASISSGLKKGVSLEVPATPLMQSAKFPLLWYHASRDLPKVGIQTSADLAYFSGLYAGDGVKNGTTVGIVHGPVEKTDATGLPYSEWQDQIVNLTSALGFRPVRRRELVYLGSTGVMRYFEALGLVGTDGRRRFRIPDWVLEAGKEAALQFLGGLIDADGTIDKEDAEPSITTKDAVFAGELMALLRTLDFLPRAEPCWNKTYKRWYYRIHIRRSESLRLKKYLRHRGKRERLRGAGKGTQPPPNFVMAIIPAGKLPCVDVSMKGRQHLYWCNGLITHNSANFSMAYGGGPSAIRRATGCDELEAARHHRAFTTTNSTLKSWWDEVKNFGRAHGFVTTAFGRRYPIPDILLTTNPTEVRAELMKDENRERFTERIRDRLRSQYRLKSKKTKIPYDPNQSPLQMAAKAFMVEYRADDTIRKKVTDDQELARKAVESVKKAELFVVNEQVDRNKKFKSKAERNATNGPVQGLSADITKIAMALIYKECRKRGWLGKVLMIITIHDELVFEIDEDIAAEAIELFQNIMARNPIVLGMKWPVPLTTDCEIGFDWSVPWNLKDFKYKRVRPDGLQTDEHGKLARSKGKLSSKLWPRKFLEIFGPMYGFAPILDNPTQEEGEKLFGPGWVPLPLSEGVVALPPPSPPPAVPETPAPVQEASEEPFGLPDTPAPSDAVAALSEEFPELSTETVLEAPPAPPPRAAASSPVPAGEVCEFRVRVLGIGVADKLAQVIVDCQGGGTHLLKVYGPKGEDLLWPGADIRVNQMRFKILAEAQGL